MNRTLALSAALVVGMTSGALAAPRGSYKWLDANRMNTAWVAPTPATVSHVIYLNNCKSGGCQMKPGYDNATTNTSSIPEQNSTVTPFNGTDATWQAVVQCVRQTYADFDVEVVDQRPTSGNYHMAIVAGYPSDVQMGSGVMGVSPFSCGYISNAVSYTFANLAPSNVAELCWTVAQETAHSWGLDHKYDNRDPMTYLSGGPTFKTFQNEAGACGEYSARQCQCSYDGTGSAKMNSYDAIMRTFGSSAPDVTPPSINITYPTEGAQVTPSFPIRAEAADDRYVTKVEFRLNGQLVQTKEEGPWNFNAPASLGQGKHKIELTAFDRGGNSTKSTVNVQHGTVCATDAECTSANNVCLEGHCVVGPGGTGGLGVTCTGNDQCASGQCGNDGSDQYCVEACDPTLSGCPAGFACVETGGGAGVCWPSDDGGGCSTSGDTSSKGAVFLLFGLVAIFVTRKRRG